MDVWEALQSVFGVRLANIYPGIQIRGLDRFSQEHILRHVLCHVREIEPMLEEIDTGIELFPQTIEGMIDSLLSDNVDGMVWVETVIDRMILPQIGFFVPDSTSLSIHYIMGTWSPLTLIGLLELLRWIVDLGDHIQIGMEEDTAPRILCEQFNSTWQAYLNDKGRS